MSVLENESYMQSGLFHEAMEHFQVGRWEEGFAKLGELESKFPMETDLRALRREMEVRARIGEYEVEENKTQKSRTFVKNSLRLLSGLVILLVAFLGISNYSEWIQGQVSIAQAEFSENVQFAEMTVEFRNAQQLFMAGKSSEALEAYESIQAKDPEYPGLADAMAQAQALQQVEDQYTQAMELLRVGDSAQALSILQEISREMPNYRDVSLQIKSLQSQSEMTNVLQQADKAYFEARFEDAITGYESLRLMDPSYDVNHVEEFLFESYVRAAQARLSEPVPSMATLRQIDDYFSKALSLRPLDREALAARTQVRLVIGDGMIGDYLSQAEAALAAAPDSLEAQLAAEEFLGMALSIRPSDSEILAQYQLAKAYVLAVNNFARGKWDAVIEGLEFVLEQDPGYADGTATQTLYDAYIARGTDSIVSGEYALALEDFQRSAILAQQLTEADSLAFEAQLKIAEAQGLLNHFQEAVMIYQDALAMNGLRERIIFLKNSLTDTLEYAEYLASIANYQNSFYAYRRVVTNRVSAYNQATVITVKNGDYISMLARRYNTTVAAILSANDLNNQPRLTPNQKLIIPTLP